MYRVLMNVFHSMNITMTTLGHLECEVCVSYKQADPMHFSIEDKDLKFKECAIFMEHKKKVKEVQEKYKITQI